MNNVCVVVLNWNGVDDTLQCLDSLLAQTYTPFHVLVVDNGSVDDSVELLQSYQAKHSSNITLVLNKTNLGFAGGVNTGIRWALERDYAYIALFNNDATAKKTWLKELVSGVSSDEIGVSTGLLLHEDGSTIDSSGDWVSHWGLSFPRSRGESAEEAPESGFVFSASGGASLYRTALFRDIGLFDEDFFAYYEDVDVSYRAQLAGWKVRYTPKAVAYHKQGATSSKIPGFTVYQTFKNLPLLFIKNTPLRLIPHVGVRFYLAYFLMLGNAIFKGSAIPALKGFFVGGILSLKKLMFERPGIQRSKKVSADYIRSLMWNDLPPEQTGLRKFRRFITGR